MGLSVNPMVAQVYVKVDSVWYVINPGARDWKTNTGLIPAIHWRLLGSMPEQIVDRSNICQLSIQS